MQAKVTMKPEWNQSFRWPRSSTTSRQPRNSATSTKPIQSTLMPLREPLAALALRAPLARPAAIAPGTSDSSADRHVDEENPVPRIIVGDPAAERRTDRRRDDHGDAVERESLRRACPAERCRRGSPARSAPCRRRRAPAGCGNRSATADSAQGRTAAKRQ